LTDLDNIIKINHGKLITVSIPNQKNLLKIKLVGYSIAQNSYDVLNVEIINRGEFKIFTDKILKHYIIKELNIILKYYSIDPNMLNFKIV